jgi:hypothetical protein
MSAFRAAGIKSLQKAPLLVRTDGCAPTICDVFTATGDELANVCFLHMQDICDLAVAVIKCFAQNICCTFTGREFLKEQQDRKLQCLPARSAPIVGSALVSTGSGSQVPT